MRVIAGRARSLKLEVPEGEGTRPTTDRIKETLFNILQGDIPGCVFVDLFAGSGGVGIEALSRGAKYAWFVENNREAISCISSSTLSLIREKEVDIIFIDPPYQAGYEDMLFKALHQMPYVTENTLLILEAQRYKELDFLEDTGFQVVREKNYKTNKHVFIKKHVNGGDL